MLAAVRFEDGLVRVPPGARIGNHVASGGILRGREILVNHAISSHNGVPGCFEMRNGLPWHHGVRPRVMGFRNHGAIALTSIKAWVRVRSLPYSRTAVGRSSFKI
jgi:hypothetical protein